MIGLTWTEAAWLVKLDENGEPGSFLRASEIGLKEKEPRPTSTDPSTIYDFDYFVALKDGQPVAFDPYAEEAGTEMVGAPHAVA